ncbi:NEDD8 protease nep2, variant 3 [Homalodisca vitripennis]|nr:NEDD8 protease nep2 [Homalodisca vitripennis]KAG8321661.1 NEDD8 protease nep2, variant 2 [Homalodisca vitripennis]KAG8321662.1 NEDD8 protease nep2, variant 3 [Homalodisca vitripennis]
MRRYDGSHGLGQMTSFKTAASLWLIMICLVAAERDTVLLQPDSSKETSRQLPVTKRSLEPTVSSDDPVNFTYRAGSIAIFDCVMNVLPHKIVSWVYRSPQSDQSKTRTLTFKKLSLSHDSRITLSFQHPNNFRLRIASVTHRDEGLYQCMVSNTEVFIKTKQIFLKVTGQPKRRICETEACKETAARILSYMDPSVRPCDDFYKFACGKFIKSAEIRDTQVDNSSFTQVQIILDDQLTSLLSEESRPDEPIPYRTMKHLYSLCMDEEKINARGVDHAISRLKDAGGWPVLGNWNKFSWNLLETEIRLINLTIGGYSLFKVSIGAHPKNTSRMVITVVQVYLDQPRWALVEGVGHPVVESYYWYMVYIAVMYGADRQLAEIQLYESLLFEIELARITESDEENRDIDRFYNPYRLEDLMSEFGWINWKVLIEDTLHTSVRKDDMIFVRELEFLKKLEVLLKKTSHE